jgi:septal ring-binding cell division protein DamX
MSKRHLLRPTLVGWIVSLILVSLLLPACGSAAESTSEVPTVAEATGEVAATSTEVETPATEERQAAPTEEVATQESPPAEAEAAQEESELTVPPQASTEASCQTVDPTQDALAGIMNFVSNYLDKASPNPAIAAVTDTDWAKGQADAPITFIEYGDFQ